MSIENKEERAGGHGQGNCIWAAEWGLAWVMNILRSHCRIMLFWLLVQVPCDSYETVFESCISGIVLSITLHQHISFVQATCHCCCCYFYYAQGCQHVLVHVQNMAGCI